MSQSENNNMGVDLEGFLELFLFDSAEQIEKLSAGLLQLEKDGGNVALINDLFRSAHSLKGSSGTMGFAPIVSITHVAEDLLDRLRQGKLEVSLEMIDVLLAVTDRVREMLAQVEQQQEISVGYEDLVSTMKGLLDGGRGTAAESAQVSPETQKTDGAADVVSLDFGLNQEESEKLDQARILGHHIYQVDVKLSPDTVMKAVRAVMVTQRIEELGSQIKILPSVDDLETSESDVFYILMFSDESGEDIRKELLEISDLKDVVVHCYPAQGASAQETPATKEPEEEVAAEILPQEKPAVEQPPEPELKKEPPTSSPAAAGPSGGSGGDNKSQQVHTIRVDTTRMDYLINLVGEMVITRTRLVQLGLDLKEQYQMDNTVKNLNESNVYLGRLMNDLQESVMRLRMVAIGTVFNRFPRLVRDLAKKTGKEINLVLNGEDTELDKTVVEVIGDPLMHLIRNSVDHGIEEPEERRAAGKSTVGTITLDAYHEGNHIVIAISDDGAGLDLVKIRNIAVSKGLVGEREELSDNDIANLIFLPGFSTAEKVTDISGRGVGMDVVKKSLGSLGAMIDTTTRQGKGTTFTVRLPLTLAIMQALLVEVGAEIYAVPLSSVLETLLVKREEIKLVGGLPVVQLRGNILPLISLREKFGVPNQAADSDEAFVVVVGFVDKELGILVDGLLGQQEVVIKSLGDFLSNLPGIAGATIHGDGKVTLILDIGSLVQDALVTRRG